MSDSKLTSRDMEIVSKVFQCFSSPDAMKIDNEKLAQLAGFSSGKSANASWNVIKKKLMAGATVEGHANATTPKKGKAKAATNGDADDDEEATPTKATPKKRGKAIKIESADAEGGDADTEKTPSAETPKKGRAKKGTGPSTANADGDATNDNATNEAITTTPKRKRGPNKPKDPNATPTKRTKKGANAVAITEAHSPIDINNLAAHAHLDGDDIATQTNGEGSIFGGDANPKKEEDEKEVGDARPFDTEEQKMANDALCSLDPSEGQVA